MRPNTKSCQVWNIDSTTDETIERNIHINPRDCARRTCANSNQQAMRNAFFLLIAPIAGHFQPRRHRMSAQDSRATLQNRSQVWNEVTGVKQAAYIANHSQHLMVPNIFLPSTSTICFAPLHKLTIPVQVPV